MLHPAAEIVLRNLADEIRADAGRRRARVLLTILGAGPDNVRKYVNELDAMLGTDSPGLPALLALVQVAERAVDGAQKTVPRQHFLSQVVQRRWEEPVPRRGKVLKYYDLDTGDDDFDTTKNLGVVFHFVHVDSQTTEDLWGVLENDLNRAVDPTLAGTALSPAQLDTVKECVALHYIRNPQIVKPHHDGFAVARQQQTDRLIELGLADQAYYDQHGLWPAGPQARQEGADLLQARMAGYHASGGLFRLSIQRLFETVRDDWFDRMNLELVVPASSSKEFLVGDVPALTVDTATKAAGIRNGVAIGNADLIFMPLAPKLVAIVGTGTGVRTADDAEVDEFNRYQVTGASKFVYCRPGLDFSREITTWRPPAAPMSAPPAAPPAPNP